MNLHSLLFPAQARALADARARLASVSAVVDDSAGWSSVQNAPGDRPWADVAADLEDALEAWRKNFLIRRIVNLMRSYVVGKGIVLNSREPGVDAFLAAFWNHPKNHLARRLGPICDQLTRDGELFPILFTNPADGMSYVRFRTARQIREIETLPNDWEEERIYHEQYLTGETKRWYAVGNPLTHRKLASGKLHPVMLHWAVNRPLDATRGESDLTPILPWARRYQEWLTDRVRLNRQRTRQAMMDVEIADDTQVEIKRAQLRTSNPIEAGIYVHGPGERVTYPALKIEAGQAEEDGRALRLAIATGANIGMHYLGEGQGTNYATAREMGEPTARFYTDRQQEIIWMLEDLAAVAYWRYCLVRDLSPAADLQLVATVAEVAREDNANLAAAARDIAQALAIAGAEGWIDDATALSLMMKFTGETLTQEQLAAILTQARAEAAQARAEILRFAQNDGENEEDES